MAYTKKEGAKVRLRDTVGEAVLCAIAPQARSAVDLVFRIRPQVAIGSIYRALDLLRDVGLAELVQPKTRRAALLKTLIVDDATVERACRVLDPNWFWRIEDAEDNHDGELSDGMIATRNLARAALVAAFEKPK